MATKTKFINYKPGPPESMFLDERTIEVEAKLCRHTPMSSCSKSKQLASIGQNACIGQASIKLASLQKHSLGLKHQVRSTTQKRSTNVVR